MSCRVAASAYWPGGREGGGVGWRKVWAGAWVAGSVWCQRCGVAAGCVLYSLARLLFTYAPSSAASVVRRCLAPPSICVAAYPRLLLHGVTCTIDVIQFGLCKKIPAVGQSRTVAHHYVSKLPAWNVTRPHRREEWLLVVNETTTCLDNWVRVKVTAGPIFV